MGIGSNRRVFPLICALGVTSCIAGCGARTPLSDGNRQAADAGAPDSSVEDGSSDGDSAPALEASLEASLDAGQDINAPDAAMVACLLQPVGEPVEVFSLPDQDLHTPSVVVLNAGDPATAQPARVALQTIGGDAVNLIAMTVQETPAGIAIDSNEPMPLGGGTTYAQMVHAPGDLQQLALVWGADGPGNEFRTVDILSWTPGALVPVSIVGWTPNGLAAGMGVHNTQSGQYEGLGYGMTWQGGTGDAPHVAVLSATGEVQVGPLSPAVGVAGDMLESSIGWSGSTYLMATRFHECAVGDPLCREESVVVTRLRVKPASNSIEFASSFEIGTPGWSPGHPTLDGRYLVFDEGSGADDPRVVHIEELSQEGVLVGTDHVVSYQARPLSRTLIGSAPAGKVVGWAETGDPAVPDDMLGRSKIVIQTLRPDLGVDGVQVELAITRFGSAGPQAIVPLEYPRGVLVAWSARSRKSSRRAIFAQFLPCGG